MAHSILALLEAAVRFLESGEGADYDLALELLYQAVEKLKSE